MDLADRPEALSLYLHIPFCHHVCHYCDFAKTANHDRKLTAEYFQCLETQLAAWLRHPRLENSNIASIFLGGGTPSLFTEEYAPLFQLTNDRWLPDCEVTLEANPPDCTTENLLLWRDLGINRISLGVQTLQERGLSFLTRKHSAAQCLQATERAMTIFPKVNVDLIYGWPSQTNAEWQEDLETFGRDLAVGHLSLYCLTYEPRTPIGRAQTRGKIHASDDDHLFALYKQAIDLLDDAEFAQDEVSNWSREGQSCLHNWVYWQDDWYLGIGCGAHSYLPEGDAGLRFFDPTNERSFVRRFRDACPNLPRTSDFSDFAHAHGYKIDERKTSDWLLERVAVGLRTSKGIDLAHLSARTKRQFQRTPTIERGIAKGMISYEGDQITLSPRERFREQSWTHEIYSALQPS